MSCPESLHHHHYSSIIIHIQGQFPARGEESIEWVLQLTIKTTAIHVIFRHSMSSNRRYVSSLGGEFQATKSQRESVRHVLLLLSVSSIPGETLQFTHPAPMPTPLSSISCHFLVNSPSISLFCRIHPAGPFALSMLRWGRLSSLIQRTAGQPSVSRSRQTQSCAKWRTPSRSRRSPSSIAFDPRAVGAGRADCGEWPCPHLHNASLP